MVDMHSHCLPALDDGAKDVNEALLMLEDAYKKGIRKIVATPHCKVYTDEELSEALKIRNEAYEALFDAAKEKNVLIPELIKGFEVHLDTDVTNLKDFRKLCIEGTDFMLIEMPMWFWDSFAMARIEALLSVGITPILAHIDRYIGFKRNIEKALLLEGVIYQINADAFLGWRRMKLVKKLFKLGKTVVAGSDMHNMGTRKNLLNEAMKKAIKKNKSYEMMFKTDIFEIRDNEKENGNVR